MAGECSHSTLLETAIQQCYNGPSVMASAHESYLKIIDDLKNDLEQISCEVIMVQKECTEQNQCHDTDDVDLENSLRELESQNDRLEQALKQQTETKEAALTELQTNNKSLKCQIAHLNHTICEKDRQIACLTSMVQNVSQIQSTEPKQAALEYVVSRNNFTASLEKRIETLSEKLDKSTMQERFLHRETRKLTEELNESRKKSKDLITQAHRLGDLLKRQETYRMEFAAKYEELEQNYEDQAKKLRSTNNQLCVLQEKFLVMERRQNEHNMERNLLREEVLSLKENNACAIGRQKSLQEHLHTTEKELSTAHDVISEQKAIMQRAENMHNEERLRLQEDKARLKRNLVDMTKDYQKLQDEYEKQMEIGSQQLKLIENFRKWKDQQLKAEESTRQGLKMYQDHIRDMLEEKQKLLHDFHDLSKEYSLLQNELQRLKLCPLSLLNNSSSSIAKHLELVRPATRLLSEQSVPLQADESNASRGDASSTYERSEEPI